MADWMHEMQTTAVDDPSICQSVRQHCCANTAEWIEVLLGVRTLGDPRNIVLDKES